MKQTTFKTHKTVYGRVIFVTNSKPYGPDFKESQIRKIRLNQYEVLYINGFTFLGISNKARTLEKAKELALKFIKGV